ncbi:O-antigen ligase family protein [Bacillus sp. FJAT-29790]|uniref:O-antigen ligase family protein n=1 Tax=Bacillus sp. FJAT-29790 TaxID=1895002 RepID=UPI001C22A146|nr:O-antigen ligase family protein [Bacillus sp. FJAT-29790]MBU8880790.1 O-antigen ligase family protein [Bacillus sp. FJAT-29790]
MQKVLSRFTKDQSKFLFIFLLLAPLIGYLGYNIKLLFISILFASAILVIKKPLWVLFIIMVITPLAEEFEANHFFISLNKMLAVLLLGILIRILIGNEMIGQRGYQKYTSLYIILFYAAMSSFWAADQMASLNRIGSILQMLLFAICIIILVKKEYDFWFLLAGYTVGSLISAIFVLASFIQNPEERAAVNPIQNPAVVGFYIYLGIYTCLILSQKVKRIKYRWFFYLGVFLQVLAALTTQTRSFIVALIITVLVYIVYRRQWHLILFFSAMIAFLLMIMPSHFGDRALSIVTLSDRGAGRLDIWKIGLAMISENFLFGVGFDNFRIVFNQYFESARTWYIREGMGAHNLYLMTFAELGLFGFLAFVYFLIVDMVRPLIKMIQKKPGISDVLLLTFLSFMIEFFFIDLFVIYPTWLVIGFIYAARNIEEWNTGIASWHK